MALTLTDPHLDVCQPCPLKHTDCSGRSKSLLGKPDYQRLKLFGTELHLGAMENARSVKLALSQSASRQPNAKLVMYQDLNASGATVCKQISALRLRRTKDCNDSSQRGLSAGAHVQRLGSQPDRIDADHETSPRTERAHPSGSEEGHCTVMVCSPKGSSMITDGSTCLFGATFRRVHRSLTILLKLCEEAHLNLAYRWFCRLSLEDEVVRRCMDAGAR